MPSSHEQPRPEMNWLSVTVLSVTGLLTLTVVPWYALVYGFDGWQVAAMVAGIVFCEISITAGYHRLWSHRAYEAHWLVRLFFAIGGTYATQNSILHWASDHRQHHQFVDDSSKDPYSAKRGFWYAHIGWMLREYGANPHEAYENCKDLRRDPIVRWQHQYYVPLALLINFGIPVVLGLWHGDLVGMLLLAGVARLAIAHHMTFLINSLAHIWGRQPYADTNSSKDNAVIALLTMGEGYHNYHHRFQRDYRNGIRWWQFDPTKWLIRGLGYLGLTKKLYRTPLERIETARAQMLLRNTSRRLALSPFYKPLTLRLQEEYDLLMVKINAFAHVKGEWMEAKKHAVMAGCDVDELQEKVMRLKADFLRQKKNWVMLNAKIV